MAREKGSCRRERSAVAVGVNVELERPNEGTSCRVAHPREGREHHRGEVVVASRFSIPEVLLLEVDPHGALAIVRDDHVVRGRVAVGESTRVECMERSERRLEATGGLGGPIREACEPVRERLAGRARNHQATIFESREALPRGLLACEPRLSAHDAYGLSERGEDRIFEPRQRFASCTATLGNVRRAEPHAGEPGAFGETSRKIERAFDHEVAGARLARMQAMPAATKTSPAMRKGGRDSRKSRCASTGTTT